MGASCVQFAAQPEAGRLNDRRVYEVTITSGANGAPRVTRSADDGAAPTFELTADYERWRRLISGTLDIPLAVVLGRLHVRSDLARITSRAADARPLLNALRAVDTHWLA